MVLESQKLHTHAVQTYCFVY